MMVKELPTHSGCQFLQRIHVEYGILEYHQLCANEQQKYEEIWRDFRINELRNRMSDFGPRIVQVLLLLSHYTHRNLWCWNIVLCCVHLRCSYFLCSSESGRVWICSIPAGIRHCSGYSARHHINTIIHFLLGVFEKKVLSTLCSLRKDCHGHQLRHI